MSSIPEPDEKLGSLVISGEEEKSEIDKEQGVVSLDALKAAQDLGLSPEDIEKIQKHAFKAGKRSMRGFFGSPELSPKEKKKKKEARKRQKEARRKNRNKNRKSGMKSGKGSQQKYKRH